MKDKLAAITSPASILSFKVLTWENFIHSGNTNQSICDVVYTGVGQEFSKIIKFSFQNCTNPPPTSSYGETNSEGITLYNTKVCLLQKINRRKLTQTSENKDTYFILYLHTRFIVKTDTIYFLSMVSGTVII